MGEASQTALHGKVPNRWCQRCTLRCRASLPAPVSIDDLSHALACHLYIGAAGAAERAALGCTTGSLPLAPLKLSVRQSLWQRLVFPGRELKETDFHKA